MNDDENSASKKPSQIPSWLIVGFLVGVVTMWFFHDDPEPVPGPSVETAAPAEETPLAEQQGHISPQQMAAVFEVHRGWVFWTDNKTEIAMWNNDDLAFTDHFEVIRTLEGDYFRPIARFSRLPLPGYGETHSPILFTETAEQRAKRDWADNPTPVTPTRRPDPIEFKSLPPPPSGG